MISINSINKRYGEVTILNNINLSIEKASITCIKGASGAGKSTLLHIIGTLDKPDSGTLLFNNSNVLDMSSKQLAHFRNKEIGFIFQFHHLLPEFSAIENVCIPAWILGTPKAQVKKRAEELLHILGLEKRQEHKPNQLSGGEQQRVAVARALINNPSIVLADEPTGNLDSANAKAMHDLFAELRKQYEQTFLIVTHNDALALTADRTLYMKDGVFVKQPSV
jgi:lipoprotein-releasing system ATP-binding protein